jgi:hypothetical protein
MWLDASRCGGDCERLSQRSNEFDLSGHFLRSHHVMDEEEHAHDWADWRSLRSVHNTSMWSSVGCEFEKIGVLRENRTLVSKSEGQVLIISGSSHTGFFNGENIDSA